jgi:glutamyl-tRNA synthetase
MGGQFILRIEDTDRERSTQESVDAILEGMAWLGLDYDEGPLYQTQRFDRYREVVQQLLDNGHAYYCDCSRERLEKLREEQKQAKQKPRYDGCCRDKGLGHSEQTVIRFRNPDEGDVIIDDLVKGQVVINNKELDDLIIERSDDTPTYNLTVVVDDWDMKISHVIRGDDHLNNTPRQINILKALGAELPKYAHVPMILGADGKRLSKRYDAVSVLQYKRDGYLPEAMINYLVRLGWSHGDQEIFSSDEMIEHFDISGINKSPATFSPEKLQWFNSQYMMKMSKSDLAGRFKEELKSRKIDTTNGANPKVVAELLRERSSTFVEMVSDSRYFYQDLDESEPFVPKAAKKHLKAGSLDALQMLFDKLTELEDWTATSIHQEIQDIAEELSVGMGKVGMPLRVAVTGGSSSPSIDVTTEVLGREKTLARIKRAIEYVQKKQAA